MSKTFVFPSIYKMPFYFQVKIFALDAMKILKMIEFYVKFVINDGVKLIYY